MTEKILHKKPNGFIALCAFLVLYIAALVVCCIGAAMLEDMTGAGFYAMLALVIAYYKNILKKNGVRVISAKESISQRGGTISRRTAHDIIFHKDHR